MESKELTVEKILKKIGKPDSVTPRGTIQFEKRSQQIEEILKSGKLEQTEKDK